MGYVADATDCDDTDASVSPAEVEVCDTAGADEDCDGYADDDDDTDDSTKITLYYDGDGYGDASISKERCETSAGGTEACDASDIDEDCDGLTDDSDTSTSAASKTTYYLDADGDGYGVSTTSAARCEQPSGYNSSSTDCDDGNALRDPGNTEVCYDADLDEGCDTLADDSDPSTSTASKTSSFADADGYGDAAGVGAARLRRRGLPLPRAGHGQRLDVHRRW